MANVNLSFKLITDNKNTFFTNNKFISAESLPVEGDFIKGDIIVNIGETADTEAMWVCIESGNPGVWEVVGAGVGGGSSNSLIGLKNNVTLESDANEVEIGIEGFNKNNDMMTVYKNSVYMMEGKDYEFNEAGDRIVAMNGEVFKAGTVFGFVVLKEVPVVEEGEVIDGRVIEDGSIGLDKLDTEVKEAIEAAGNIDMSEYVSEEELEAKGYLTEHQDLSGYATKEELNELFQDVDSGKTIIADAIDDRNISKDSTFAAMGEAIEGIHADREEDRQKLIDILVGSNMDLTGNESMDTLLDLIDTSNLDLSKIIQVACGGGYSFILYNDGRLYSCGYNYDGQLGLGDNGDNTERKTFTQVTTNINNDVKQVFCNGSRTFIIKNDGSLWGCGNNISGQLGLGSIYNINTFTQITTNVKQVSCGGNHTMIIKNDGSLWSTGYNNRGQLGLGDSTNRDTFTQVTANINNDVKQVACGSEHTFILKNDGTIWGCGYNYFGQLGRNSGGNANSNPTFVQVTINVSNDVKQIACGGNHTMIIKNDGSLWGTGNSQSGQLGVGVTGTGNYKTTFTKATTNINNDVKQVACGDANTFILKNDGSVWSCGLYSYGQLGLGTVNNNVPSFRQVTNNINNDVKQIVCGGYSTFIIKNDGSLWGCGYNSNGQLGIGSIDDQSVFIPINQSEALQNQLTSLQLEATANRGNLATVLTDEGVELTGDETLADLIVKTDEEFDRKNEIPVMTIAIEQGWTTTANIPQHKSSFAMSAIDNDVYVMGGYNSARVNTVYCYNTTSNSWTTKANMLTNRDNLSSAVVNGQIYAMGGYNYNYLNANECYDPATNTWTSKSVVPEGIQSHVTESVNNNIYLIGGLGATSSYSNVTRMYDTTSDTWTTKANKPTKATKSASAVLNGKIYVIGGYNIGSNNQTNYLTVNECYDPATNTWTTKAPIVYKLNTTDAACAKNNKLYLICSKMVSEYNLDNNSWTYYGNKPPQYVEKAVVIGNDIYALAPSYTYLFKSSIIEYVEKPMDELIPVTQQHFGTTKTLTTTSGYTITTNLGRIPSKILVIFRSFSFSGNTSGCSLPTNFAIDSSISNSSSSCTELRVTNSTYGGAYTFYLWISDITENSFTIYGNTSAYINDEYYNYQPAIPTDLITVIMY